MDNNYKLNLKVERIFFPANLRLQDLCFEIRYKGKRYLDSFPFTKGFNIRVSNVKEACMDIYLIIKGNVYASSKIVLNGMKEQYKIEEKVIQFEGKILEKKNGNYRLLMKVTLYPLNTKIERSGDILLLKDIINQESKGFTNAKLKDILPNNILKLQSFLKNLQNILQISMKSYQSSLDQMKKGNEALEKMVEGVKKDYKTKKKLVRHDKKVLLSKKNIIFYHKSLLSDYNYEVDSERDK